MKKPCPPFTVFISLAQWTPARRTQKLLGSQPLGLVPLPPPLREHWPAQVWRVAKAAHTTPKHALKLFMKSTTDCTWCILRCCVWGERSIPTSIPSTRIELIYVIFVFIVIPWIMLENLKHLDNAWENLKLSLVSLRDPADLISFTPSTSQPENSVAPDRLRMGVSDNLAACGSELIKLDIESSHDFSTSEPSNKNYIVPIVPQRPKKSASLISSPVCIRKQSIHLRKGQYVLIWDVFWALRKPTVRWISNHIDAAAIDKCCQHRAASLSSSFA